MKVVEDYRSLNNVTVEISGEEIPVLDVDVIPDADQDPDLLTF